MDNRAEIAMRHLFAQDFSGVILGATCVNDQRQARFPRCSDVSAKTGSLPITVAVVVIIVESGFSNGDDPRMIGPILTKSVLFCSVEVRVDFISPRPPGRLAKSGPPHVFGFRSGEDG